MADNIPNDAGQGPNGGVKDELRMALATCGAITLVVYESGVCHELERMIREVAEGIPGTWSSVFKKIEMTPVVDVLTGASAGGINSVLLGSCLATRKPFNDYRDVWVQGLDADKMKFGTTERPDALFNVQGVFESASRTLKDRARPDWLVQNDLDVHLCLTDYDGECVSTLDALGHQLDVVSKSTVVRFEAGNLVDFDVIDGIAKSAKATSAFPGLFSPVSIDGRWFVDGGLWNNQPIDLALDAIRDRRATQRTTRVLLFIDPDPSIGGPLGTQQTPTIIANVLKIPGMGLKGSILPALEGMLDTNRRKTEYDELIKSLHIFDPESTNAGVILSAIQNRAPDAVPPSLIDRIRIEQTVLCGNARRVQTFRSLVQQFRAMDNKDQGSREAALWLWATDRLKEAGSADLAREAKRREIAEYSFHKDEDRENPDEPRALKTSTTVHSEKTDLYDQLDEVNAFLDGPRSQSSDFVGFPSVQSRLVDIDSAFSQLTDLIDSRRAERSASKPDPQEISEVLGTKGGFTEPPPNWIDSAPEAYPPERVHMALAAISDLESKRNVDLVRISPNDVDNHHLIGRQPTEGQTAAQLKLACDGMGHVQGIFEEKWRRNDYVWGRLDAAEVLLRTAQRFGRVSFDESQFQEWLLALQAIILQEEADVLGASPKAGAGSFPKTAADKEKISANVSLIGFGEEKADPVRIAGKIEGPVDAAERALRSSSSPIAKVIATALRIARSLIRVRIKGGEAFSGGLALLSRINPFRRRA